jgi:hypothetical protein
MKQSFFNRAKGFIKDFFTKNKGLKLLYVLIVVFLCYAPSFCNHTKITTPSRDAYHLYELAQCVETEAELRNLEHEYQEMELAYRQRYNGATAIKFRLMTQHIVEDAAARRDCFRTMEDAEANAELALTSTLDDLDAAWQIDIPSKEEAYDNYTSILDDIVSTHMKMRANITESIEYYKEVADADYPEDMLATHKAIEDETKSLAEALLEYHTQARQYNIAYKLKYDEMFSNALLLERYLAAFDGNYTRINKGVDYGDVEFVIELLNLASNRDELNKVSEVKNTIHEAYIADAQDGDAALFNKKLEDVWSEAEARIVAVETFEYNKADFESIDWDAFWNKISAPEPTTAVAEEGEEDPYADFDVNAFLGL